ncbi:serine hydrolase domain-containing protein [Rhodohalobacter mucosus]|nr:serine hydrolase domain-containing protein [Rhodohalobacter mucosus]
MNQRIPVWMENYQVPGAAIALIQNGKVAWSEAYGLADKDDQIRMKAETIFRVESISKSVTARGVMKLVETGKIKLEDPVYKHLVSWEFPETEFDLKKVTIRHLLSHTSGLALGTLGLEYDPNEKKPSLRESLTREVKFIREPGTSFNYSNVGFNLLELLIEDVSGRSFADFMKDEVLSPLGMQHADFIWREDFPTRVPDGHKTGGESVPVYVYAEKGAGGLFANVKDIAAFVSSGMVDSMYSDDPVLSQKSLLELYMPVTEIDNVYSFVSDYYGLGHFIEILPNGKKAVFGGGQGNGWMSHFHIVPESGDGIVILTNSSRSWPLISSILSDWAQWAGVGSIGMGIIVKAMSGFWLLILLIFAGSVFHLGRVFRDCSRGNRKVKRQLKDYSVNQFVQLSLFVLLSAAIILSLTKEYLFITSVFPGAASWFLVALIILASVLLISGLTPPADCGTESS